MNKIICRFKNWNKWRKNCLNSWWHKLLVLFGLIHSPTFEMYYDFNKECHKKDYAFLSKNK